MHILSLTKTLVLKPLQLYISIVQVATDVTVVEVDNVFTCVEADKHITDVDLDKDLRYILNDYHAEFDVIICKQ